MATADLMIDERCGGRAGARHWRWPTPREWLVFAAQVLLVGMVETGNDIVAGNLVPPDASEAVHHARSVAAFEAGHGFFVEPAIQQFFLHSPHILGIMLSWHLVTAATDQVYAFGHIFVTLGVAAWVFVAHRRNFARLRNVMLLTTVLALVGYEIFPTAPPRLTTGLLFDGHLFHFRDTMQHIIGDGRLNGVPIAYNAFSAMPSLHVAWALISAGTLVLLARSRLLKVVAAIYPAVMVFTVVVTANHYLMDAIGASIAVVLSVVLVIGLERVRRAMGRQAVTLGEPLTHPTQSNSSPAPALPHPLAPETSSVRSA
jgi:hypothetical protein